MRIQLRSLLLRTRRTTEEIEFAKVVTFLHGPIGKGKSSVARLIDYCFAGDLERTPALQKEFVAVTLFLRLGRYDCSIERGADENQSARVTWASLDGEVGSVNAPFSPEGKPLIDADVYNLSDLIFHLCGVTPIKVRKRTRDPESQLIRLSFRDIWWYCYLEQTHLDSSFFRLEDPFRGRKSQDAMRFFTGLHSEQLSQLEEQLMKAVDEQRSKREAVGQIRSFMQRFEFGSELELTERLREAERARAEAEGRRTELDRTREVQVHPTDALRAELRGLGDEIEALRGALADSAESIAEQKALRAEFITAKTKAQRAVQAERVLEGVHYELCPECGSDISHRAEPEDSCRLCGSLYSLRQGVTPLDLEVLRRDLNDRIDQIADSTSRRERESTRMRRKLAQLEQRKGALDRELQVELARYDSAFVESIRRTEREIATLVERIDFLSRLRKFPEAIAALEEEAGSLQGRIDRLRTLLAEERIRLSAADENIAAIASEFKRVMLAVAFPGLSEDDHVVIDPRNWKPAIQHGEQEWTFWDTGSGGKKTLFNVCYALALHAVALDRGMPLPGVLIIDSPTKNISKDENPELVRSLYAEIYRLAARHDDGDLQFLLIDSDLVGPALSLSGFSERRMAGEPDAPSLISYYTGP